MLIGVQKGAGTYAVALVDGQGSTIVVVGATEELRDVAYPVTEPRVVASDIGLRFTWQDGHFVSYPWSAVIEVRFTPEVVE